MTTRARGLAEQRQRAWEVRRCIDLTRKLAEALELAGRMADYAKVRQLQHELASDLLLIEHPTAAAEVDR